MHNSLEMGNNWVMGNELTKLPLIHCQTIINPHSITLMYLSQLPVHAIFLYSIVVAALLIYVPYLLVAFGRLQIGYDFSAPRAMFDKLPAYAQRATWAHQNSFEGFIVFAPAALMAYVTGVNSPEGVTAAIAFIIARLLYSIFYIANIPLLRSLMFIVATVSSGTLFWLSLMQMK
jgi:uncharacterized MAPEG superfamily protein